MAHPAGRPHEEARAAAEVVEVADTSHAELQVRAVVSSAEEGVGGSMEPGRAQLEVGGRHCTHAHGVAPVLQSCSNRTRT